jgi:hypothetical protein
MVVKHFGRTPYFACFNYVTIENVCSQCVEWLIMSYNTLTTLRMISETMFRLAKMTKLPS